MITQESLSAYYQWGPLEIIAYIINTGFYRVFNMINYGTLAEFGYPKQSKY
jgi:hypothetical protein